ncbi:MAG TPA: amino acid permease [Actinomycetales bacterium]
MARQQAPTAEQDAHDLAEFGYVQRLDRSIGRFSSFAAGVSYISILTGTFQLFYFGYSGVGPLYVLSWPLVFLGQLMVALCFAELAARFPVAGSVYNWTKKLASPTTAWMAGWMMLTASVVSMAAVTLAYQLTLPQIWSGFQMVGDGTGTYDVAINAVILGTALLVFTTLINALGVRLLARINSVGVAIELGAAVVLVVLLAFAVRRGPDVALQTNDIAADHSGGVLGAFLVASLASGYVMYGFDTASSLGEETVDPRRTGPTAIIRAIVASFILGGLILLLGLMAVPDLADPLLGSSTGGLQRVVLQVLPTGLGTALLCCIAVAITVCALAVHTAAIRLVFAMARDDALPASSQLARVHPRRRTPWVAALVIGLLGVAILVANIRQAQIFTVVTSIAVVLIYLAYLMVTGPMLVRRLRGTWPPPPPAGQREGDREYFSLGRWGLPVNIAAVVWGAAMALNLAWPRAEVYDAAEPHHWYLRYGAFLFIGAVVAVGLIWCRLRLRSGRAVLAEHAVASTP